MSISPRSLERLVEKGLVSESHSGVQGGSASERDESRDGSLRNGQEIWGNTHLEQA